MCGCGVLYQLSCSVLHNRPHIAEEQKIEGGTSDGEDLAIDQLKVSAAAGACRLIQGTFLLHLSLLLPKKERDKLSKEVEFHHHAIESVQVRTY